MAGPHDPRSPRSLFRPIPNGCSPAGRMARSSAGRSTASQLPTEPGKRRAADPRPWPDWRSWTGPRTGLLVLSEDKVRLLDPETLTELGPAKIDGTDWVAPALAGSARPTRRPSQDRHDCHFARRIAGNRLLGTRHRPAGCHTRRPDHAQPRRPLQDRSRACRSTRPGCCSRQFVPTKGWPRSGTSAAANWLLPSPPPDRDRSHSARMVQRSPSAAITSRHIYEVGGLERAHVPRLSRIPDPGDGPDARSTRRHDRRPARQRQRHRVRLGRIGKTRRYPHPPIRRAGRYWAISTRHRAMRPAGPRLPRRRRCHHLVPNRFAPRDARHRPQIALAFRHVDCPGRPMLDDR